MTDFVLHLGVSNLCVSLVLALAAWTVQKTRRLPLLAHLLWLLVLAKLVTPPLFTVPVIAVPAGGGTATGTFADPAGPVPVTALTNTADLAGFSEATASTAAIDQIKSGLILFWLLGSACVLAWSAARIYRFNRLLGMAAKEAAPELQRTAAQLGTRLGLRSVPTIYTTSAHLSPMVWWIGGVVRILLPAALPEKMDAVQVRLILAHELAHVRRRDHLIRWLEWLACVGFWWNPVTWWARRNLRINEEICCDALVLESLEPDRHTYANSLLSVVEFLAAPALRPPAVASGINSGGFLQRRFEMIVSSHPVRRTLRWVHAMVLFGAMGVLPLGVAHAQDPNYKKVAKELKASIAAGEITPQQAEELIRKTGLELRVAIAAGGLTPEEARKIMASLKQAAPSGSKRMSREDTAEAAKKLKKAVAAGELTEEEARAKLGAMRKEMAKRDRSAREDYAALEKRLEAAVTAGKISEEEAKERLAGFRRRLAAREERGDGIEGHFKRLGVDEKMLDRIRGALETRGGMPDDQVEKALGAMVRIMHGIKESTGEDYELDPRMRAYLEVDGGFTDEQIEMVVRLSQRVVGSLGEREQKGRGEKIDWESIKRRIESAVERGDLTREEADAKYAEIKKRMAGKSERKGG